MKKKVLEAIDEFERIASGTLTAGPLEKNYFFPCDSCGTEIRKLEKVLKHGQIINCVDSDCLESYVIDTEGFVGHIRRVATISCSECGTILNITKAKIDRLHYGEILDVDCDSCKQINEIRLIAAHKTPKKMQTDPNQSSQNSS